MGAPPSWCLGTGAVVSTALGEHEAEQPFPSCFLLHERTQPHSPESPSGAPRAPGHVNSHAFKKVYAIVTVPLVLESAKPPAGLVWSPWPPEFCRLPSCLGAWGGPATDLHVHTRPYAWHRRNHWIKVEGTGPRRGVSAGHASERVPLPAPCGPARPDFRCFSRGQRRGVRLSPGAPSRGSRLLSVF